MDYKEEAEKLICRFWLIDLKISEKQAKVCALICVDEILKAFESDRIIYGSEYRFEESEHWNKIKSELEKM